MYRAIGYTLATVLSLAIIIVVLLQIIGFHK